MNKTFPKLFILCFAMLMLIIPIKANAASFDGTTEISNSVYIVPYGNKLGVTLDQGETLTSDNENICKIDNSGRLKIVGVGKFSLTSKKNDNEEKINFFAWNACLKKDGYTVFSDVNRSLSAGIVNGKTYFAVSNTSDKKSFKIEEHLFISGNYTGDNLDGKYITSHYNETSANSDVNNYVYALDNKFDEDDDETQVQIGDDESTFDIKLKLGTKYTPNAEANLTWIVENEDILQLENASTGTIRGIRVGSTTLIGKSGNTKKVELKIKVYRETGQIIPVTKIILDKTTLELKKDEIQIKPEEYKITDKEKLNATVVPSYADNRKVSWASSNNSVASVTTKGRIKPKSSGTVTITASTINGISAACAVTITDEKIEKIHFLNINSYGDCMMLEADGKFALIDTGNGTDTNSPKTIISYLNKLNIKELEFILITHPHKDHMGGFASIVTNNFKVNHVYIKNYDYAVNNKSYSGTINQTLYTDLQSKCSQYNIPITYINSSYEGKSINLNSIKITFYNTYRRLYTRGKSNGKDGSKFDFKLAHYKKNVNVDSIATLITSNNNHKVLLTGDQNTYEMAKYIIKKAGDVDIYKMAHHGQNNSTGLNNSSERDHKLSINAKYLVVTISRSLLVKKGQTKTFKDNGNRGRLKCNGKLVSMNDSNVFFTLEAPDGAIVFEIGKDQITHSKYNR